MHYVAYRVSRKGAADAADLLLERAKLLFMQARNPQLQMCGMLLTVH